MHLIEEAFGENCDLYEHVLACPRDADQARLRKAYYRRALAFHPDKQQQQQQFNGKKTSGDDDDDDTDKALTPQQAQLKFQAVSLAYQILQDADARATYDETGEIPDRHDDDDDDGEGMELWKAYFDRIFGKVTTNDIESFSSKYKCSDEERRDVVIEFRKHKGNLVKMLEYVMLSEARDAQRWVEDYLRPAMEKGGELEKEASSMRDTMEKTLKKLQKQAEKENQEQQAMEEEQDGDEEETESEDDLPPVARVAAKKTTKAPPKKAKPTKAKTKSPKKQGGDMSDLIAQIQNKKRGGGFASLAARYGVAMEDSEDPLNDEDFAKAQSRLRVKGTRSRR